MLWETLLENALLFPARPRSAEDCGKRSQTLCVPSADSSSLQLLPAPSCGAQATAACSALSPACSWEETRTTEL